MKSSRSMTEKTRVYLIRHGEIAGNNVFRYNGQTDVPLTPRGLDQFRLLAKRLLDKPVSACYTSDLSRCAQGADIICAGFRIKPVSRRELREMSFGNWEGMSWMELEEKFPEEWKARLADLSNYRVPGGENLLDLSNRVMPEILEIAGRHTGEEVVVVAHGGVNRVILLNIIGAPHSSLFRIEQDYGCMNIIDFYADGNSVVKLLNG
jgi:alpha-ribazole phosphatase